MLRDGFDILLPKVSLSCLPEHTRGPSSCAEIGENGDKASAVQ